MPWKSAVTRLTIQLYAVMYNAQFFFHLLRENNSLNLQYNTL